ncbi:MAG: phosphatase PAP2 family protein [Chitinophagaceae bacterium]
MQSLNYRNFFIAVTISLLLGLLLIILSFAIGKNNFFLLLNADLGIAADYFFSVWTDAGDGLLWIFVLLIIFVMKRKDLLPLIISAFIFTTIFTQICKYVIVPDEARPWKAISNHLLIHHVSFVEPLLISSFPSGHTATAFTFYLLFCLIISKNWWLAAGLLYGLLVGYSRIYLAQHFPLDVGAGIITGVASVSLSLLVQLWWMKKR